VQCTALTAPHRFALPRSKGASSSLSRARHCQFPLERIWIMETCRHSRIQLQLHYPLIDDEDKLHHGSVNIELHRPVLESGGRPLRCDTEGVTKQSMDSARARPLCRRQIIGSIEEEDEGGAAHKRLRNMQISIGTD